MQIAGETEVKGLIKLRLRTAQGSPIVVHRSFMLTQQKSKKTFKTLDGSIQTRNPETGELVVLSNRCAEIDTMVPYLMNVSKPVLEHVVFVHQEDSLWPLSESKPLKEKFDAIFAASKYTAAVVKIKELIKETNQVGELLVFGWDGQMLGCVSFTHLRCSSHSHDLLCCTCAADCREAHVHRGHASRSST
jgi:DNA repair protein RAD50